MSYRIGIGYDIHKLVKGRPLILGGVKVPYPRGLKGHSDADVLTHAICDAILGAAGLDDIGQHFPDSAAKYKNISSMKLLKEVNRLVGSRGYAVKNIDVTVIAEEPKITPVKKEMIKNIAAALNVRQGAIGIKATTNEGIGDIGRKKAIASLAVAMLAKKGD